MELQQLSAYRLLRDLRVLMPLLYQDVMPFLSEAYNFAALRHRHFKEDALCNMRSAKLSMKYAMFLSYMDARLSSYKVDQKNAQS